MTTLGTISVKVDANTKGLEQGLSRAEKRIQSAEKKFNDLATAAKLAATVGFGLAANQAVKMTNTVQSMDNVLRQSTNTTKELNEVYDKLFKTSKESRSSLESTVGLYAKMERSTRNLNLSQDRLVSITSTINKAFALSGATSENAANAIRQLGQAFDMGVMKAEEYNSVQEQAPRIIEAMMHQTGKTKSEIKALGAEGKITSELLIKSLESYVDVVNNEYANSMETYSQKMEDARGNALNFVRENKSITDTVNALGDVIVSTSKHLDVLAAGAMVAAIAVTGRYAGALALTTKNKIALAIASTKATTSVNYFTASTARATAGTRALALSAGAAKGALALLGGPAGVIMLAAASLLMFSDNEDKVESATRKANERIKEQTESFKALSEVGMRDKMAEFSDEVAKGEMKLAALNGKAEKLAVSIKDASQEMGNLTASKMIRLASEAQAVDDEIRILEESTRAAADGLQKLEKLLSGKKEEKQKKEEEDFNKDFADAMVQEEKELAAARKAEESKRAERAKTFASRQEQARKELSLLADSLLSEEELEAVHLQRKQEKYEQQWKAGIIGEEAYRAALNNLTESARLKELEEFENKKALAQEELAWINDTFMLQEEAQLAHYDREKEILDQHLADKLISQQQHADAVERLEEAKAQAEQDIAIGGFKDIFSAMGKHNKAALKLSKAFAIAEASISIARGIAKAQELGFPANIAEMARVATVAAGVYSSIKGASAGAAGSAPSSGGGGGGGGGSPAPQQSQGQSKTFNVKLVGESQSSQSVRELLGMINEEVGNGFTIDNG